MRRALLVLPVFATFAACTSGGFDFGAADSAVFVGAVTGVVHRSDGSRAASATVYLADGHGGAPNELGGSVSNAQGHFQVEAVEGTYVLVAYEPGYVAYVTDVKIFGGETTHLGEVHLQPCSPGNPCPANPDPTPAPPTSFVIHQFDPDYTEVSRYSYPSSAYDEVYVRAENLSMGIEVTFSFLDPASYGIGTYGLSTSGIFGALTYLPPDSGYPNSYIAVAGSLTIEQWNLGQGGVVSVRISDARYDWYDPYAGSASGDWTATIDASSSMQGNVLLYQR